MNTNTVPAAAVIRGGQALFKITGRKGHVGGLSSTSKKRSYKFKFVKSLVCEIPEFISGRTLEQY